MIENKVIKNASWMISMRIVQAVMTLVISMITARYLGPADFGLINYASSIVAFVIPIMNLGLTSILVNELIGDPENEGTILGSSLVACFVSAVFCCIGVFCFVKVANGNEPETVIVTMLYSLVIFAQVGEVLNYWYQAHLLSKYTSIVSVAVYFVVSVYKIFLLITGKNVRWFAVSNALDFLLIALALAVIYRHLGGQKLRFSWSLLKKMLAKSKYYIISCLMVSVFAQTDRIMLKLMLDETATGYYSASVAIAGMTSFVFIAIIDSGRPAILESRLSSDYEFKNNVCRLYSIVIYLALFQSIGITLFAKLIVYILYGSAYMPAAGALRIVIWYTTFSYMGAVRNIWLLAEGKQYLIWKIDLSGAVANILLNAVLIPKFGINGAAVASLVTQFFTNFVMGWVLKEVRPNNSLIMKSVSLRYFIRMVKDFIRNI